MQCSVLTLPVVYKGALLPVSETPWRKKKTENVQVFRKKNWRLRQAVLTVLAILAVLPILVVLMARAILGTATNHSKKKRPVTNCDWRSNPSFTIDVPISLCLRLHVVLFEGAWGCADSSFLLDVWWLLAWELLVENQVEVSSDLKVVHHWFHASDYFHILNAHSMLRHVICHQTQ